MTMVVRGMDAFSLTFNKMDALQQELDRREAATERPVVHTRMAHFDLLTAADAAGLLSGKEPELVEDTGRHANMVLCAPGGVHLLDAKAFGTVKSRIEIFGAGFDELTLSTRRLVLNERFDQLNRDVRLIIIDGKLRAVMSAGTAQSYAVMPMNQVVREVFGEFANRLESPELKFAELTYDQLVAYFRFPKMKEDLTKLYNIPTQWMPGIRFSTSDTGYSANAITPYWSVAGSRYGLALQGESIYLEHRGSASVADLVKQLPKLFGRFQNVAKWMVDAMAVEVKSPKGFVALLGKHLGLSKKFVNNVLSLYDAYARPAKTTVYTIVEHVFEAMEDYEDASPQYLENQVGKLFTIPVATMQKWGEIVEEEKLQLELFSSLELS